jgi:hypothetical protein
MWLTVRRKKWLKFCGGAVIHPAGPTGTLIERWDISFHRMDQKHPLSNEPTNTVKRCNRCGSVVDAKRAWCDNCCGTIFTFLGHKAQSDAPNPEKKHVKRIK